MKEPPRPRDIAKLEAVEKQVFALLVGLDYSGCLGIGLAIVLTAAGELGLSVLDVQRILVRLVDDARRAGCTSDKEGGIPIVRPREEIKTDA